MDSTGTFKLLGNVINEIVSKLGMEDKFLIERIKKSWKEIVGEKISDSCTISSNQPDLMNKGELIIETVSSTWRAELLLQRNKIRDDLNRAIDSNIIKEIVVK